MSDLPVRTLDIIEQWDCHGCGLCCKGHTVLLEDEDLARLESQHWEKRPEFAGKAIVVRAGLAGPRVLAQRQDGSCIFLTDDGKCLIHRELGEAAKPWACRMFPFQFIPREKDLVLTMRRNCPSAASESGKPLREHLAAVRPFIEHAIPTGVSTAPPMIVPGLRLPWPETRRVTDMLARIVVDESRPLVHRLVEGLGFVAMLEEMRPGLAAGKDVGELIKLARTSGRGRNSKKPDGLQKAVTTLNWFSERKPPARHESVLFRQAAAEYARHHPNLGDRPGFFERIRLLWAAVRIARGKGSLPRIHPDFPEATFADLEAPLPDLSLDVYRPLDRYFAAATESMRYCGAGHFGWPVVDGFRTLALELAISLWMLRWLSHGRTPTARDSEQVVCMIDRSHYYRLLAGRRHRLRVATLAREGGIERLIAWYSR